MYSGSDSAESQNYPQWALNPSTYQNMSNDQVDWAALAQQWIIMKEAGPPPLVPDQNSKAKPKKEALNEGGEAPMEVENEKEEAWNSSGGQQPQPPGNESWSWNAQNQTWGWNNAWAPPTGVPPPAPMKPPLLPTPANYNQFNAPPESNNDNATFGGYNTTSNNDYTTGYWTSAGSSKQIKPHNRRFSKVNVPRPVQPVISETQPPLDAAKRKQLPAWIREGLEKMERDKQKQIEKEKEKQEREEYNEKLKQTEKETMEILKSTIKEQQKSKFESDGEYSDDEVQVVKKVPEPVQLTPEEQMLNVRRTMTEILLKVTSREIETICREELQRYYKKHKASDHRVSAPSGANVTAKLGLGMYGGDSGSSDEDSDDEGAHRDQRDSDSELKESIKRKKAEFSKTEREIEDKLAEADSRKQGTVSRSPTPDTNGNDTQVDAKAPGRRPARPEQHPKNSKRKSRSSSSSSDDGYAEAGRKKRSSTDSSPGSAAKRAKRARSRSVSRSRTPDGRPRHKGAAKVKRRSRSASRHRRESTSSKHHSRRSRSKSRSRSRSRRSRSSSYRRSRGRRSRSRNRRSRSRTRRSRSRSDYSKNRRSRSRKRRSRSSSSSKGKRARRR